MQTKQRSILSHIRQVVTIGIIVLVVLLETSSIIAIQKALSLDTKNEIMKEASSASSYIDSWLAKKVEETELISESFVALESFTDEEVQEYLTKCASLDSDVLNYYLCRAGIPYVVYNGGTFDLDPTGRSWWTDAWNAKKTIITDAYVDANSGAIVVSFATPFYLGDTQCVVLADITMDTLVERIKGLNSEYLSVFLSSSDGSLIVHNDSKLCIQPDGTSTKVTDIYGISLGNSEIQSFNDENGKKNYIALSSADRNGWIIGAYLPNSYMANRIVKALIFGLVIAILVGVFGIMYFGVMLSKQLRPMSEMKRFIKDVVIGNQNEKKFKNEKDEISYLIEELKIRFVETIRKTKVEMYEIDGDIQDTSNSVGEIVDAVNNISAVIEETAASMDMQTSNISSISNDCIVISNASIAVANQAQEMAIKSSEIESRIDELAPKMKAEKEASLNSCNSSQEKLHSAIKEAECIKEITSVTESIRNIASQTNLLSLNASIESARAGEAGRGFAVVAEEIRGLSDQTNEEINKIGNLADRLLDAVTTLSEESIQSMNSLSRDIEQAYESVDLLASEYVESARYFSSISAELGASSEELSASVQTVAKSVEDISASQNDVNVAMDNASKGIQVVATDASSMKNKVENVSSAVVEVTETVQQFNV